MEQVTSSTHQHNLSLFLSFAQSLVDGTVTTETTNVITAVIVTTCMMAMNACVTEDSMEMFVNQVSLAHQRNSISQFITFGWLTEQIIATQVEIC